MLPQLVDNSDVLAWLRNQAQPSVFPELDPEVVGEFVYVAVTEAKFNGRYLFHTFSPPNQPASRLAMLNFILQNIDYSEIIWFELVDSAKWRRYITERSDDG